MAIFLATQHQVFSAALPPASAGAHTAAILTLTWRNCQIGYASIGRPASWIWLTKKLSRQLKGYFTRDQISTKN